MVKNVGAGDRVARIVLAILLAVPIYVGAIDGVAAIVAGIAAAYLVLTAIMRSCLFYKLAGVDTTTEGQPYSTTDDRAGL